MTKLRFWISKIRFRRGKIQTLPCTPSAFSERDTLNQFGVSDLVVGHTEVEQIEHLFDNSVHAIEVDDNAQQALMITDGVFEIRQLSVTKKNYIDSSATTRDFEVTNLNDWKTLLPSSSFIERIGEAKQYFGHTPERNESTGG